MSHMLTGAEELKATLAEVGADEPENAAFLSNVSGWSGWEILAADAFWETGQVTESLSFPTAVRVYANDSGEPFGVAVVEDLPRGRWSRGRKFMVVRCADPDALDWMFSLLPVDEVCEVEVEQQDLLPEIEKRAIVKGCYDRLYFGVERELFKPTRSEEVAWLDEGGKDAVKEFSREEAADEGLAPFYLALQLGGFPFAAAAVMRPEGISSFCCIGKKTEQVWSVKWICTRAGRRRCGEGKRVLTAATTRILEMGKKPLYSARDSNAASRRLCESLGYRPVCVRTRVELVRKSTRRGRRRNP